MSQAGAAGASEAEREGEMAGRPRLGAGLLLLAAGVVALAAGVAGAAHAQGRGPFDGQYVGEMALTGIINGDCSKPPLGSSYPLTITGGVVRFKYVPRFDTTLVGRIDPNGNFKATALLHHGMATMTGHVRAGFGTVTANIVTPSCQYSFQTK